MSPDPRPEPGPLDDERATLTGFLAFHRATLELKCAGLDAGQMARRAAGPSSLSLLGLVRHLADVERGWFRRTMGGQDAPPVFFSPEDPDGDFDGAVGDPAVVDGAWAAWRAEVAYADALVASIDDLGTTGTHHRMGPVSLRWVLTHMVEEYARHNGHADLLRQAIDGQVGE